MTLIPETKPIRLYLVEAKNKLKIVFFVLCRCKAQVQPSTFTFLFEEVMPIVPNYTHTFPTTWPNVAKAFWKKYDDPSFPHLVDIVVLDRTVDSNGILRSKCLVHSINKPPEVFRFLTSGFDSFFVTEETTVDPKKQILIMEGTNITYSSLAVVHRRSEFKNDASKTVYNATMDAKSVVGRPFSFLGPQIERAIESQGGARIRQELGLLEALSLNV